MNDPLARVRERKAQAHEFEASAEEALANLRSKLGSEYTAELDLSPGHDPRLSLHFRKECDEWIRIRITGIDPILGLRDFLNKHYPPAQSERDGQ